MVTIVEKMATCEYYAQIYDECLRVKLATSTTTKALDEGLDAALKDLYAAVRAFLDKAREYFDPEINGRVFRQITGCRLLTGYVDSDKEDYEPLKTVFGHHATPDSGHFGQRKDSGKVCRNGHDGKDQGFVLNFH